MEGPLEPTGLLQILAVFELQLKTLRVSKPGAVANACSPKHLGNGVRGDKGVQGPSGLHTKFEANLKNKQTNI